MTKTETVEQRVTLAINRVTLAINRALQVYPDPMFHAWAKGWLDGADRSRASADATRKAALAAGSAAWYAAAADAAEAWTTVPNGEERS